MFLEARLDLRRVDVLGGRFDEPRLRTDECDRSVLVATTEIARVVPAASVTLATRVAIHHGRPTPVDLADLAGGQLASFAVDDAYLRQRDRSLPEGAHREESRHFGLSVAAGSAARRARVEGDHRVPRR